MLNKSNFLVNFSDLEERLDPIYYFSKENLDLVNETIYPVYKLIEVIKMQRGRFGHRPRNDPAFYNGEYPFIQTGDIVKSHLTNNIQYSQTLNEKGLKTSRLFDKPVVVFTIAANIGYTAILNYPACFPDSLIGMTAKNNSLKLEYINIYLGLIRQYIEDLAPQAAQKNINYQQLSKIPVVVPSLEAQEKIIKLHQDSLLQSAKNRKKAKDLLESINQYLLNELGIELPQQDNSLESRVFIKNFSNLTGGEWSSTGIFNKYLKIEGGIHQNKKLFEVSFLQKGQSLSSKNLISGDYPVIAGGQTSPYFHATYNYEGETITISASGAYSGYVWYHSYPIFASDCTVIKVRNEVEVLPLYLAEILKCKQQEIYTLQKGAGQPHVYLNDLAKLNIPLPPLTKQKEIVTHIQKLRNQAKQLEQEAEQVLIQAKQDIEACILGNKLNK